MDTDGRLLPMLDVDVKASRVLRSSTSVSSTNTRKSWKCRGTGGSCAPVAEL